MTEVRDDPKPVDYLFAALAVLLFVLGVALMVGPTIADTTPAVVVRIPVTVPAQLIAADATREG